MRRVVFVVVLLSITIVSTRGLPWETARPDHKNPVRLPSTYAGWEGKPVSPDREYFGSTRHTQSILRRYRKGGAEAIVFLAVDTRKRPLVSGISPKNEMLGPGWQVVSRTPLSLRGGEGVRATVSIQKKLDWYAYVVHWQQGTDSFFLEALRNALAFDRSPFQRPYDATVARIGTGLEANTPQARKRALDRIQPLIDLVLREFPAP